MKQRTVLPALRHLLDATARLRADTMIDADRQLIGTLLDAIARDQDVRSYFFEANAANRPKEFDSRKFSAAIRYCLAEQMGDKDAMRNKALQAATGLSRKQVGDALKFYTDRARAELETVGAADIWAAVLGIETRQN